MQDNYTSKQLGLDLKKILNEKHDVDLTKVAMWCDYKLNREVYCSPDPKATECLRYLIKMRDPNFITHQELHSIAEDLIQGTFQQAYVES